jgi:ADP-dependent NAD(P)H-hydrate dehydratase
MSNPPIPKLAPRPPDSHKGTFGHALLIGGSRGMAGAISLAGMAALRSGAGLVTIATADNCLDTVAGFEASYMTVPLASDAEGRIAKAAQSKIAELAARCTTIGCGPGMQRSADIDQLVAWLYQDSLQTMIVDADALNALSAQRDILSTHAGARIVTPHPGEFARLLGIEKLDPNERMQRATEFAEQNNIVVVLKGHRTIVTDGERTYVNETGNPGMATGGCGDVLTGTITALAGQQLTLPGQGLTPFQAAQLGVHIHGRAGDLAAAAHGETSLIASDLVRCLPEAFKWLTNHQP